MKLTVLGSSSRGNCYLLDDGKNVLILECGVNIDTIKKTLNFDYKRVVGCLVTHEHKDHAKSLKKILELGIDVYASSGTFKALEVKNHRAKIIDDNNNMYRIGDFVLIPFKSIHDAKEPLNFLISHHQMGKLVFITDSKWCKYGFNGINHALVEANYHTKYLSDDALGKRIKETHFEIRNTVKFLKNIDSKSLRTILLLHLSSQRADKTEFIDLVEESIGKPCKVAEKGLEIELRKA